MPAEAQLQPQQQRSNPLGFLNVILNPIRTTLDQTRNFLGHRAEGVQERLDKVRLRAYQLFLRAFNKTSPAMGELKQRASLFFQRREVIKESVRAFREGRDMFSMKMNEFVDWNEDELRHLTGVSMPPPEEMLPEERVALLGQEKKPAELVRRRSKRSTGDDDDDDQDDELSDEIEEERDEEDDDIGINVGESIPANKDWRQSGCIADPLDQRDCGACYAIATMGTFETMRCLNQESAAILSSQQIVDCSSAYKNFGCNGGWPTRVLKYLQDNRVVTREACYPFVRRQTTCRVRQVAAKPGCSVQANVAGGNGQLKFKVLNSERDILYFVATQGPVVTVMKASNKFLYYGQGIFDDRSCSNRKDDVDHAIQIVGYGRENGIDYWLIKNSWGKTWGIGGYGKYRRGVHACSIGYWGWAILP